MSSFIDWETGRSMGEDVSMQLSCYAMYAMEKLGDQLSYLLR